jgi:hypothetical protein
MYNSSDDSDYEHQGATDDSDDDLSNSTPSHQQELTAPLSPLLQKQVLERTLPILLLGV